MNPSSLPISYNLPYEIWVGSTLQLMILGLGHNENDFKNQIYGNKKTFIIVENGDFAKFARGLIGANDQR